MKIRDIVENWQVASSDQNGIKAIDPKTKAELSLPADMQQSLQADPSNPNKFTLNPQAIASTDNPAQQQHTGPAVGAEIEIPMATTENSEEEEEADLIPHNHPVGGDGGDDFVLDVTNGRDPDSFENHAKHAYQAVGRNALPEGLAAIIKLSGL